MTASAWDRAGKFSRSLFLFFGPTIRTGAKRALTSDDLDPIASIDDVHALNAKFSRVWAARRPRAVTHPSRRGTLLFGTVVRAFKGRILWTALLAAGETGIRLVQPVLLKELLRAMQDERMDGGDATRTFLFWDLSHVDAMVVIVALLAFCIFALSMVHHALFFGNQRNGFQFRQVLTFAANQKLLRVHGRELSKSTTGKIVSLLSNDVAKMDRFSEFAHFLWASPLLVAVVLVMLIREVGAPAALAGILLIVLVFPLNAFLATRFTAKRDKTASKTDERVKLISQLLSGILAVKMYAWETPSAARVADVRREEMSSIRGANFLRGLNQVFFFVSPVVAALATFLIASVMDKDLEPSSVFPVLAYLNLTRIFVNVYYAFAVESSSEGMASLARIEHFLLMADSERAGVLDTDNADEDSERPLVVLSDAAFAWDKDDDDVPDVLGLAADDNASSSPSSASPSRTSHAVGRLNDISLTVSPGETVVVVGAVGQGKSSLLHAILGEMTHEAGEAHRTQSISYAGQEPWIMSGTVRENITFGCDYDAAWYDKVLDATQLKKDLLSFADGDRTPIGERGVTLSGGQKARLALARAVYRRAALTLLDDPLSAVDPRVGHRLMENCIGGLMRDHAVVLVTHQVQMVRSFADRVVVMDNGTIAADDTFDNVDELGLLDNVLDDDEDDDDEEDDEDEQASSETSSSEDDGGSSTSSSSASTSASSTSSTSSTDLSSSTHEPVNSVIVTEDQETGTVNYKVYTNYIRRMGTFGFICTTLFMAVNQATYVMADWTLSQWSNARDEGDTSRSDGFFQTWLAIFVAVTVVICLLRTLAFFVLAGRASTRLHDDMFNAVLHAPLSFFHANPSGRILNRFSKDAFLIDEMLPMTFFDVIQLSFIYVGALVLIFTALPWAVASVPPLGVLFIHLRSRFLATGREVKRLESVSRSPVFSQLGETFKGLTTIHALAREDGFDAAFLVKLNENGRAHFAYLCAGRWLGSRLDLMTALFYTITLVLAVALRDSLTPASVGLTLAYSVNLTGFLQFLVRQSAELENVFTSVERCDHYVRLEPEADDEAVKPAAAWPPKGVIEFADVTARYRETLDDVLTRVSFKLGAGQKMAVVGRTGSGKSTTILTLWRLLGLREGTIRIDGVDTSTVPLEQLRRSLAIIPQTPTLFSGSLRFNLDPFTEYSDEDIMAALDLAQLGDYVRQLPRALDSLVTEDGANFSVGQRQLICLARALLRRPPIVVLDEATSNVDHKTDRLIQIALRRQFRSATAIVVAHRISTIIDLDVVLVLQDGHVAEFGRPVDLLDDASSLFAQMVEDTGEASVLRARARRAADGLLDVAELVPDSESSSAAPSSSSSS